MQPQNFKSFVQYFFDYFKLKTQKQKKPNNFFQYNIKKNVKEDSNTTMLIEKEIKPAEICGIEFEEEDQIVEECDKKDYTLGCYLKEIYNYVRNNEVKLIFSMK